MKKSIVVILFFLVFKILYSTDLEQKIFSGTDSLRIIGERVLPSHERLKFKIQWEFVPAGESVMTCNETVVNGRKVYHIVTQTTSNSSMDVIYKVRNRTESFLDYNGLYSLKFVSDQNESGRVSKEYILFDQKNGFWYSILENKSGSIPQYVQDIVSSLYYLRTQNLNVGEKYLMDVYSGKVSYPMIVSVLKQEEIKIGDKKFKCLKLEPKVDEERFSLFRIRGKMFVWLTDDEKHIPVKMQTKIFIGSVYAILEEYNYN